MPNADTKGFIFRQHLLDFYNSHVSSVFLVENLGSQSYLSVMNHSGLILGNSSSGIIEAASLKKYVINIGNRQAGRLRGENIIDVPFEFDKIVNKTREYMNRSFEGPNPYGTGNTSEKIIEIISNLK